MLFHVTWEFTEMTEASEPRHLAVLAQWQPPAGAHFQAFFDFADNSGGVAILDVDSAATLARTTAPWGRGCASPRTRSSRSSRRSQFAPRRSRSATR